jgi:hypothetical protein
MFRHTRQTAPMADLTFYAIDDGRFAGSIQNPLTVLKVTGHADGGAAADGHGLGPATIRNRLRQG